MLCFESQAETGVSAQMGKRARFQVDGLPSYIVSHVDTK